MIEDRDLPAGDFSAWLAAMRGAISGENSSDVPCDGCTACCTSAQFIHIGPEEADALGHIPAELLFPAPRLPRGHVLMGYDERGHCPMLIDNRCSIYEHRPRTCRTYDCRIFPAAGLDPGDDKAEIAARARRWQFSFETGAGRAELEAVRAAARFLTDHLDVLPGGGVAAASTTQLAVAAIDAHPAFLDGCTPDRESVRVELTRRQRRE